MVLPPAPWQPTQAFVVRLQKLFEASLQSVSAEHSTQVPAPVPLAIQIGLVAALVEHAVVAAPWQPTQVLVVVLQKLFAGSLVQFASVEHSTQVPAPTPLDTQTGVAGVIVAQTSAWKPVHPVQVLLAQIPLVGSLQSGLPPHSTQAPVGEQTGRSAERVEHAVAAAPRQPTQALATQKLLVGSLHSESWEHEPMASGETSDKASELARSGIDPSTGLVTSTMLGASRGGKAVSMAPPSEQEDPVQTHMRQSGALLLASWQTFPPLQSAVVSQYPSLSWVGNQSLQEPQKSRKESEISSLFFMAKTSLRS